MLEFPQPTRPFNSYDCEPMIQPEPPCPLDADDMSCESSMIKQRLDLQSPSPPPSISLADEEKETIEQLLGAITTLYAKLPPTIRSQVNLDKFNIPSKVQKSLHKVDSTISTRGVQGSMEELSVKLERFKIRTIQLGEVVKEEEEKR
ncbi:hypothetical protein CFOL_v3_17496 [Cephalotus follicularis]|uniref:Uncharacterized protein n=1 Tax=Cephalotus follicularis TaxID=3775 RepID=A0A1Q3C1U8_CEPFO|nr:hypothetical protein CFOL_v3_17496 [Cephalotus follicularis]